MDIIRDAEAIAAAVPPGGKGGYRFGCTPGCASTHAAFAATGKAISRATLRRDRLLKKLDALQAQIADAEAALAAAWADFHQAADRWQAAHTFTPTR